MVFAALYSTVTITETLIFLFIYVNSHIFVTYVTQIEKLYINFIKLCIPHIALEESCRQMVELW